MTPAEKYDLVKKLDALSSKRRGKIFFILGSFLPALLLPDSWKWLILIIIPVVYICAELYKKRIYEPLMLKDRIIQENLFSFARNAQINYTLVLRPHAPSAFSFSDEREAGTGVGISTAPHPISQPYTPYEHGYKVFERLEEDINEIIFVALGDLHHAYSARGLYRTIFLNSTLENWEETIKVLIQNAKNIIFVPDISKGMKKELFHIMENKHLERTVFLIPSSTNKNATVKGQNKAWKLITEEFKRTGIIMPEFYDPKTSVYTAVINGELSSIEINQFLKREPHSCTGTLDRVIDHLLATDLITEKHFENLYDHTLCQRLKGR